MKTFKDLTFEPHPSGEGKQAFLEFDNGRGISVITGSKYFYTSEERPYEVAFIDKTGGLGLILLGVEKVSFLERTEDLDDTISGEPEGYCTEEQVTCIMEAIQKL